MPPTIENSATGVVSHEGSPQPAEVAAERPRRLLLTGVQSVAVTLVIAIFVITFLVQAFQIPSESMENTLLIGDYLLVDKVHYGPSGAWNKILPYHQVKRGDVIVFKWPVHPEQHFVKRVIGVPGDRVRLINGRVLVNGQSVHEDYAIYKGRGHDFFRDEFPSRRFPSPLMTAKWWADIPLLTRNGDLLVPEGSYFVLGDNRNESLDSRYWGLVPRENIVGKPLLIYFSVDLSNDWGLPEELRAAPPPGDKIVRFAEALAHLPAMARWHRTFMIVK